MSNPFKASILKIPFVYILCIYLCFHLYFPVCCFFVILYFVFFGEYTVYISSCHNSWTFVYIYGAAHKLQLAQIYIYIYIYIYIAVI